MAKIFVDPDTGDKITFVDGKTPFCPIRIITEDNGKGHLKFPNHVIDLTYEEIEQLRDYLNEVLKS